MWIVTVSMMNGNRGHKLSSAATASSRLVSSIRLCQVMVAWGVGGGIGVLAGGAVGQAIHNRSRRSMPLFVAACVMLAPVPIWWLVNAQLRRYHLFAIYAAAFVGGALASPPGPNARCDPHTLLLVAGL